MFTRHKEETNFKSFLDNHIQKLRYILRDKDQLLNPQLEQVLERYQEATEVRRPYIHLLRKYEERHL